jgi:hypothetical protein
LANQIVVATIKFAESCMPVNETVETPVTSIFLSVECLELKTDRIFNKLLHIKSAARFRYHVQVTLEYCNIGKES